jgi:hypothetical protein
MEGEPAARPDAEPAGGRPLRHDRPHRGGGRWQADLLAYPGLQRRPQRPQADHPLGVRCRVGAGEDRGEVPAVPAVPAPSRVPELASVPQRRR